MFPGAFALYMFVAAGTTSADLELDLRTTESRTILFTITAGRKQVCESDQVSYPVQSGSFVGHGPDCTPCPPADLNSDIEHSKKAKSRTCW